MKVRRVVTGQTDSNKSVFVSDEQMEPTTLTLLPGYEFHRLWGSQSAPTLPTDGSSRHPDPYFPSTEGYRMAYFTIPAEEEAQLPPDADIPAALTELQQKLPGMADVMEPDHPGMHTTDTVDFDVVISGEVWLELDDGAEVHLTAGDCVIQNGTRHAWRNRSSRSAVIAVTLIGAKRSR